MDTTVRHDEDSREHGSATSVRIAFDNGRIGRRHDVKPQIIATTNADDIAEFVYGYARPLLASRDVEVAVDMEALRGAIYCGFNNGGTFTVEYVSPEVPA